jgi:hypothetical protein
VDARRKAVVPQFEISTASRFLYGPRRLGTLAASASIKATTSVIFITVSRTPAAIAGVTPSVLWTRQKLYQTKYSASAWQWFSNFLLNALVSRVNRRIDMRMVRFCRSAKDVLIRSGSGLP